MFAVSMTGQLFGISLDENGIYKYSGTSGSWNKIGSAASSIVVGKDRVYAINRENHTLQARKLDSLDKAPSDLLESVETDTSITVEQATGYQIGLSGHDYGSGEQIVARGDVFDASTGRRILGQVLIHNGNKRIGYAKVINGYFSLYDLEPGNYLLRFTSSDGQKHAESHVSITADHTLIKIVLKAR
jgi:hypothetical protein